METRPLGGATVPVLGQGTWEIEQSDRAEAIRALRRGVDLGMTHVDTAEMYGSGRAEELVGEAIRGLRERVFLVSKVLPSNASYKGTIQACERSLKRLGTDFLDLYLLHWRGGKPLTETFRALDELCDEGKIRRWGVSNFDADDLEEAVTLAGKGKIACNQVLYHLGERAIEHSVLPWCEKNDIPVVAYSPFGSGRFPSGQALDAVAKRIGGSPRQVALQFLVRRASVFTIPKAARVAHVEENAGAAGIQLSAEDVATLEAAFPRGAPRGLPTI